MVTSSKSTFEPNRMDTPLTEIIDHTTEREIRPEGTFDFTLSR